MARLQATDGARPAGELASGAEIIADPTGDAANSRSIAFRDIVIDEAPDTGYHHTSGVNNTSSRP